MYEEEKVSTKSLKKELASYQRQMKEARLAKEEAKIVRIKLQELQAIENLVKGKHSVLSRIVGCYLAAHLKYMKAL